MRTKLFNEVFTIVSEAYGRSFGEKLTEKIQQSDAGFKKSNVSKWKKDTLPLIFKTEMLKSVSKLFEDKGSIDSCEENIELINKIISCFKKYEINYNVLDYSTQLSSEVTKALSFAHVKSNQNNNYKGLVVFEFCGVLVSNCDFSWRLLYEGLNVNLDFSNKNYEDFKTGKISYVDWVKKDLQKYQECGLTLSNAKKIIKDNMRLIDHLREGLKKLKEEGYLIAIVSGGLDLVVKTLLDDYQDLFDVMYINEMKFEGEKLIDILATPYDWGGNRSGLQGKYEAIRRIQYNYNITKKPVALFCNNENSFEALSSGVDLKIVCSYKKAPKKNIVKNSSDKKPRGTLVLENPDMNEIVDNVLKYLKN